MIHYAFQAVEMNGTSKDFLLPAGLQCMWSHGFQMATSSQRLRDAGPGMWWNPPGCKTSSPPGWHGKFRGLHLEQICIIWGVNGSSKCKKRKEPKATQNGSRFGFTSINLGALGCIWRLMILHYKQCVNPCMVEVFLLSFNSLTALSKT